MPAYDGERFSPPAPVALVTFRNPATGQTLADVPMLLDSGADVTLVPRDCVAQLGIVFAAGEGYALVGFDGSMSQSPVAECQMQFCGHTFRGRFLLTADSYGILGRNVLNSLRLVFDGPRLAWREAD